MIIFPAIDLRGGKVVRLQQGRADAQTTYSDDPVSIARDWQAQGAQALHVVDLDGAFSGEPKNLEIIGKIVAALDIPVQLGGGIRDEATLEKVFSLGVTRAVLGTKACDSLDFVRKVSDKFGVEKIAVGIDAKNGKVSTQGWTQATEWDVITLAQAAIVSGAGTIIYTDIATDGMFTGPNFAVLEELLVDIDAQLIASGGVATKEHVEKLRTMPGLYGVIIGKALYDKKIALAEVL